MKVLIVDDHPIVISGCRALLAGESDIEVLSASTAAEARRAFAEHKPDVTVIDINLPDGSGFELTRQLVDDDGAARILVFSMNDDPVYAARALASGAKGYLSKNDDPSCFRAAIEVVAGGGTALAPGLAERIAALPAERVEPKAQLSMRELDILRMLAAGRSMSEIAGAIGVSYKTVAGISAALRQKFNARTPMELVRIAVERRIV